MMANDDRLRLLAFGNPMVDLIRHVSAQYVANLGVAEGQETHLQLTTEQRHAILQDAAADTSVVRVPGGSALNTARVVQAYLPPQTSMFIGAIGDDDGGAMLLSQCEAAGVDMRYVQTYPGLPTSTCLSLVTPTKERTLITQRSAHLCFRLDAPALDACLRAAHILYVVAFTLTSAARFDCVMHLLTNKDPRRHVVCLNISSTGLLDNADVVSRLHTVLPHVQMLSGNRGEVLALGTALGIEAATLETVAAQLLRDFVRAPRAIVVVTNSAAPTRVFTHSQPPLEVPVAVPTDFTLYDTTGAGDAFLGGFFAGLLQKSSLQTCVALGHYCAVQCVQRPGCQLDLTPTEATRFCAGPAPDALYDTFVQRV
ncbi:hypothetical protein ACHHYP_11567 [Achlya hypogyna]|uniref:Adenosine kinase n=1 Tax=Achlya hypogyna TaxID=1202772 RepID=A0A1V9ZHH2_ACHHY|nr:hypothetical protein ACHHYP_11567 [Achlya hypogyna]